MRSAVAGTSFFCNGKKGGAIILAGSQAYSRLMKPIRMEPILVPEWILESGLQGVGEHKHDENDEVFYVLEGAPEVLVGECWRRCRPGLPTEYRPAPFTISETTEKRPRGCSTSSFPVGLSAICRRFSAWFAAQKEA